MFQFACSSLLTANLFCEIPALTAMEQVYLACKSATHVQMYGFAIFVLSVRSLRSSTLPCFSARSCVFLQDSLWNRSKSLFVKAMEQVQPGCTSLVQVQMYGSRCMGLYHL